MMKNMDLSGTNKKRAADSSDSDSNEEAKMEVDTAMTKGIKKTKVRNRQYYVDLKKNLRRRMKDGRVPDISELDKLLAEARAEAAEVSMQH